MASEANAAARLKAIFSDFDTDNKFAITRRQLSDVFKTLAPDFTSKMLEALMDSVDANGDGKIDYGEFVDFLFFLSGDEGDAPMCTIPKSQIEELVKKSKMFDTSRWQRVASGAGAWGFMVDEEATALRNLVRNFPDLDENSPEGLTLAEEFVLVWQEKSGEFEGYSYFGADEQFHHAIFAACLMGLRARGLLDFQPKKCKWLGKVVKLVLKGDPPNDSEVLNAVYKELEANEDMVLKEWFESKTGKWGQDGTTSAVMKSLTNRGILGAGEAAGATNEAEFKLKDATKKNAINNRLRNVVSGKTPADSRSVALLALCRTADMRDMSSMVLLDNIFGEKDAKAMVPKLDALVEGKMNFKGITSEDLNTMIDAMPAEAQQALCGDEFWNKTQAEFKELDTKGEGLIAPAKILNIFGTKQWPKFLQGGTKQGMYDVCLMFDGDNDDRVSEEEYIGFRMWTEAMKMLQE